MGWVPNDRVIVATSSSACASSTSGRCPSGEPGLRKTHGVSLSRMLSHRVEVSAERERPKTGVGVLVEMPRNTPPAGPDRVRAVPPLDLRPGKGLCAGGSFRRAPAPSWGALFQENGSGSVIDHLHVALYEFESRS
jgi:hypothetical protein